MTKIYYTSNLTESLKLHYLKQDYNKEKGLVYREVWKEKYCKEYLSGGGINGNTNKTQTMIWESNNSCPQEGTWRHVGLYVTHELNTSTLLSYLVTVTEDNNVSVEVIVKET